MSEKPAPRTSRLSVRVSEAAVPMLRGCAAFHGQTVAQYVRCALGTHVESDLELIARAMRIHGYSKRRIARAIGQIMRGEWKAPAKETT